MSRDIIFKQTTLAATMFAAFFSNAVLSSVVEDPLSRNDIFVFDGDWQVSNQKIVAYKEFNILYDESNLPSDAEFEDGDSTFMVDFRNIKIEEGARLTLRISGEGASGDVVESAGYGAGASYGLNPLKKGGSQQVDVQLTGGSLFIWGDDTNDTVANNLALRLILDTNSEHHLDIRDMFVLQEQLYLSAEDYFAVSAKLEEAKEKNANLYLGRNGSLAVDRDRFKSPEKVLVYAENGAKVVFEKGSSIVVLDSTDPNASVSDEEMKKGILTFINKAEAVEGLENVTLVFGTSEDGGLTTSNSQEGSFHIASDGSLQLISRPWEAKGSFAPAVDEFHRQALQKGAPEVFRQFIKSFPTSSQLSNQFIHGTLMQKSLGTGLAMESASDFGGRFGTLIYSTDKKILPVTLEIIGSRSEGDAVSWSADKDGLSKGKFKRDTEGAALGINAGYRNWVFGARVLYEDSNVEFSSDWINPDGQKTDSTLFSGAAYVGRRTDGRLYMADIVWTGAEDKMKQIGAGGIWVGSDDISRRSVSGGITGVWEESGILGENWDVMLSTGARLTNYLETDYTVDGNGTPLWGVREDDRWVYSLGAGMRISREWHRIAEEKTEKGSERRDDWFRLGVSGGVRVRGGDLSVRQTVSVGNASASMETDDLTRWESYAGVDLDGEWKDSRFGISAGGSVGPDGYSCLEAKAKVVWEY